MSGEYRKRKEILRERDKNGKSKVGDMYVVRKRKRREQKRQCRLLCVR